MSIPTANVTANQSFGAWLSVTNKLAGIVSQNTITTDSTTGGSQTTGNSFVTGYFGASYVYVANGIVGGNVSSNGVINILSNTAFQYAGANVFVITSNSTQTNTSIFSNTVYASGNVGIGTIIPAYNLDVNGTTRSNTVLVTTLNVSSSGVFANVTANNLTATNATFTTITYNSANAGVLNISNAAATSIVNGNFQVVGTLFAGTVSGSTINAASNFIPYSNLTFTIGNTSNWWSTSYISSMISNTITTGSLIITGNISGTNIVPSSNITYSSGNSTNFWLNGYFSNLFSNTINVYNNVITPAGSAAAPSITFTSNTDTGIYRSATATLSVAAGGISVLSVNNSVLSVNTSLSVVNTATFSNTVQFNGRPTFADGIIISSGSTVNVQSNATFANVVIMSSDATINGTLHFNTITDVSSNTYTFVNTSVTANIDSFSPSVYRSAEYIIQMTDTTTAPASYHMTKILLIQDGTNPFITEYGTIYNNINLGSFNAGILGNVFLSVTPTSANVVVKFTRTAITV
jgi:hypothetical protein